MTERLEHANLCVHDIDAVVGFLKTAFPDFKIRQDTTDPDGSRWVHIGTDETYIALNQAKPGEGRRGTPYKGRPGLNHLAYEVEDVEAIRARLQAAGYQDSTPPNAHPYRKRVYFYDPEGNDWEFVQYLSDDPRQRHDYKNCQVRDAAGQPSGTACGLTCRSNQASHVLGFVLIDAQSFARSDARGQATLAAGRRSTQTLGAKQCIRRQSCDPPSLAHNAASWQPKPCRPMHVFISTNAPVVMSCSGRRQATAASSVRLVRSNVRPSNRRADAAEAVSSAGS